METATYSRVARWLHWSMAILIIGNLAGGLLGDFAPGLIFPIHKSTGLLILGLAVLRILWRLTHRPPPLPASITGWQRNVAGLSHRLFYLLIVLIPLSGWVMASASEYPIDFYGLFPVMKFAVTKDMLLWDVAHEGHELLAYAMIALLVLHVAAAWRHHAVLKDGVLARMLG